jgi:tetratricopeptide (TPR) repeat protein
MRGDFGQARALVDRGREALADAGFVVLQAASSQISAFVEQLEGDLDAALRELLEGFEQLTSLGEHAFASTNAAFVAEVYGIRGEDDEAAKWVAVARELSPEGDLATLFKADMIEAVLVSRRGQHDAAKRLGRNVVAQAETTDFWDLRGEAHEALAEILAGAGELEEARVAQETAARIYDEKGSVVSAARARAVEL